MTDGYGLSSVIDFYSGVRPIVIGYDWQGREARNWYRDSQHPTRAIFLDKEMLAPEHPSPQHPGRPDFAAKLAQACGRVEPLPTLEIGFLNVPKRPYYLTLCDDMKPDALRILRWEPDAPRVAAR